MFKKQGFFKKPNGISKVELQDENIGFKFDELTLDNVLDENVIKMKPSQNNQLNFQTNIFSNIVKDKQKSFASNLDTKCEQTVIKSTCVISRINENLLFISKKKTLFPNRKVNYSDTKTFAKYILPSNLENLFKWLKYSTKTHPIKIDDILNSVVRHSEIKKLVPNKFNLGSDIVPSYLNKRTKKSKLSKDSSKLNKTNLIAKAYKAFGGCKNEEMNVTFVGDSKSGKSSIIGSILLHLGLVENSIVKKTEWEATKMNCPERKSAWLIDTSSDERHFKETISMSCNYVEIDDRSVNLIDSPGNIAYFDQIIKSLLHSKCVFLVLNLSNDWDKSTGDYNNIIFIHTIFYLMKVLTIDKLHVILVNSAVLDLAGPVSKIQSYWKKISKSQVHCLSLSSLVSINASELQPIIDQIRQLDRAFVEPDLEKPLLIEVTDVYKPVDSSLPVVVGKVLVGGISAGINNPLSRGIVVPYLIKCTVKSMKIHEKHELKTRSFAFAGNHVELVLPEITSEEKIRKGSFICHPDFPLTVANRFSIQMRIFDCDIAVPIISGIQVYLWSRSRCCFCQLTRLVSVEYYSHKEKIIKNNPRIISEPGCTVTAHITTDDPLTVDFESVQKLNVFFLFCGVKLFAAGKFTSVLN